jgi:hypothetical protein
MNYQEAIRKRVNKLNSDYIKRVGEPDNLSGLTGGKINREYTLPGRGINEPTTLSTGLKSTNDRGLVGGARGGKIHFKQIEGIASRLAKTLKPVAKPIVKALTNKAVNAITGSGRKTAKKSGRFVKGSAEAKAHMSKIRAMRKK